jgi:hypothetical protein
MSRRIETYCTSTVHTCVGALTNAKNTLVELAVHIEFLLQIAVS